MSERVEACGRCRFAHDPYDRETRDKYPDATLQCRRRAPTERHWFAGVGGDHWCGEFEPQPEPRS